MEPPHTTPTEGTNYEKCFYTEMTGRLYPTLKKAISYAGTGAVWRVWLYEGRMYRFIVYGACTRYCTIAHADSVITEMMAGKTPDDCLPIPDNI